VAGSRARRGLELTFADTVARFAYRLILRRPIDPGALDNWRRQLSADRGRVVPLVNTLFVSPEYHDMLAAPALAHDVMSNYLHFERCRLVHALPPAGVIVDLGGACPGEPRGALLVMGYRHRFERLTIVDVPPGESLEQRNTTERFDTVDTDHGPVRYAYHHMKDAASLDVEPGSVDMVFMGESIEHIAEGEFDAILPWIVRSLRPGGRLCIDTPNRRVTRLHAPDSFIHPDHKIEYEAPALRRKLEDGGLQVTLEAGIGRADESLAAGRFDAGEIIWKSPLNPHASESYLLVFEATKPRSPAPS
jgi:SAM-dependent methyltransferase